MREPILRYALGVYHLIAGVAGIAVVLLVLPSLWRQAPDARLAVVVIMDVALALFVVVLAAGVLLLRRRVEAIRLAAVIQVLQLPVVMIGVWQWAFFAGLYAALVASNAAEPLSIELGFKSALTMSWAGTSSGVVSFGINIPPIGVLWLLHRLKKATTAGPASSTLRAPAA